MGSTLSTSIFRRSEPTVDLTKSLGHIRLQRVIEYIQEQRDWQKLVFSIDCYLSWITMLAVNKVDVIVVSAIIVSRFIFSK